MDLTRETRQADQKIEELEGKLALKAKMNFKLPFYFQDGDTVPLCPRYFEKDKAASHLFLEMNNEAHTRWDCHVCKSQYRIEGSGYHRRYQVPGSSDSAPWANVYQITRKL